jgi:molybdopterin-containing oxidoreductase family iron-sulfur binding subunit
MVSMLAGDAANDFEQVQATLRPLGGGDFDASWRRWLHAGLVGAAPQAGPLPPLDWSGVKMRPFPESDELELNFLVDSGIYDGSYANNAWLQELPDPLTKLTWDNAALVDVATAEGLGLNSGDLVRLESGGRELTAAVLVNPSQAAGTVGLALGYGCELEELSVAHGAGFNGYALRTAARPWFATDARLTKVPGHYELASTQVWGHSEGVAGSDGQEAVKRIVTERVSGRPHVRLADLDYYKDHPNFVVDDYEHIPQEMIKSLWTEPNERGGQQWGMAVDLNLCNGCSACVVACTAENNVPTVGKENVLNGREMHWMRLDVYRWFEPGAEDTSDTEPVILPVACAHCENAPCENVCPVAATAHSPDGLNDIAYNRCIGTRYCAANCPTKVRRYNFFAYQKDNGQANPLIAWQRNPDVTVRFRGVVEKCTYCVQRINAAKIEAKRNGENKVADGTIAPACAQACPTRAITFGDINDSESAVSRLKSNNRNYAVLSELNIKPRTTYLARIRNPNMTLAKRPAADGHHDGGH